jgi:hypothetical protein
LASSSSTIASITRSQSAKAPCERSVALVRRHALLLDGATEVTLDRRAAALSERHLHLAAHGVVPGGDADLRDSRAHRAESDNADLHAGDPREDAAAAARPVDMKTLVVIALLLLALIGAVVSALRGRRPALLSPAY